MLKSTWKNSDFEYDRLMHIRNPICPSQQIISI